MPPRRHSSSLQKKTCVKSEFLRGSLRLGHPYDIQRSATGKKSRPIRCRRRAHRCKTLHTQGKVTADWKGCVKQAMIRLLFVFIGSLCLTAYSLQHKPDMPEGHHHETPTLFEAPIDQETQAKLVADKKESEFNHHLAGLFVALGGAFMLLHGLAEAERPRANYIWPATFLVSGIFVLVWSDTELWPFGPRQWLESREHN